MIQFIFGFLVVMGVSGGIEQETLSMIESMLFGSLGLGMMAWGVHEIKGVIQ